MGKPALFMIERNDTRGVVFVVDVQQGMPDQLNK
jgi:hypothetical protein